MSERFEVYDFTAGKVGWLASGLPREGANTDVLYAGDVVDPDPPTCALTATAGEVIAQLADGRYGFCLVVNDHGIVLGRVRRSKLSETDEEATVADVMEGGPSTVRANVRADDLVGRLAKRDLKTAVVTTPAGALLGVFHRADAAPRLAERPGSE